MTTDVMDEYHESESVLSNMIADAALEIAEAQEKYIWRVMADLRMPTLDFVRDYVFVTDTNFDLEVTTDDVRPYPENALFRMTSKFCIRPRKPEEMLTEEELLSKADEIGNLVERGILPQRQADGQYHL